MKFASIRPRKKFPSMFRRRLSRAMISCFFPEIVLDDEWKVDSDLHGSDHFPILVHCRDMTLPIHQTMYIINKADWSNFQALPQVAGYEDESIDNLVAKFNTLVHSAALQSIPRTTGSTLISLVPWCSRECKNAIRARKAALRRYQHARSMVDNINHKRACAYARRSCKESWQKNISSINTNTSQSKIWRESKK